MYLQLSSSLEKVDLRPGARVPETTFTMFPSSEAHG